MSRIDEPLLLLVGGRDHTTPPRLSQALYDASPLPVARKTLTIVALAGHDDAMSHAEAAMAYHTFLAQLR